MTSMTAASILKDIEMKDVLTLSEIEVISKEVTSTNDWFTRQISLFGQLIAVCIKDETTIPDDFFKIITTDDGEKKEFINLDYLESKGITDAIKLHIKNYNKLDEAIKFKDSPKFAILNLINSATKTIDKITNELTSEKIIEVLPEILEKVNNVSNILNLTDKKND